MNIHFKDKELFESLKKATIAKVKIGSYLYGTANLYGNQSDEDYLYIYATSQNELNSFIWTNHQLQYKEEGIDHNFVSVHSFIRNCLNGDSTINFEVIQSNELQGTPLYFLHLNKQAFETYTITKSYNGLAKRDIKYFHKAKTDYEKKKRLGHIIRGWLYTADLLDKNNFHFKEVNKMLYNFIDMIGNDYENQLKTLSDKIDKQRIELNEQLNRKYITKIMRFDKGIIINNELLELVNGDYFKDKQSYIEDFDMNYFINAFENWVEYENT